MGAGNRLYHGNLSAPPSNASAQLDRLHFPYPEDGPLYSQLFHPNKRTYSPDTLSALAETMKNNAQSESTIPSGYTYLGQFIDHDVTFDPISPLESQPGSRPPRNLRSPFLDLDSLYGRGPGEEPYLYQDNGLLLREGKTTYTQNDLPRTDPGEGKQGQPRRALIADPRNDSIVILGQIQLAFLRFHNAVASRLYNHNHQDSDPSNVFEEARSLVVKHYHWIVLHDFLPTIVARNILIDILPWFYCGNDDAISSRQRRRRANRVLYTRSFRNTIPKEFSVAAYRFGHSMVRDIYNLNGTARPHLFPQEGEAYDSSLHLMGFRERHTSHAIQWRRFFPIPGGPAIERNYAMRIDTSLASQMFELPLDIVFKDPNTRSLAYRNLLKGNHFKLQSGEYIAAHLKALPLSSEQLGMDPIFLNNTPLWYYILREADVVGNGSKLGPVGGRIVAEVLIGLIEDDRTSFLHLDPQWTPDADNDGRDFGMIQLLRHAGMWDDGWETNWPPIDLIEADAR